MKDVKRILAIAVMWLFLVSSFSANFAVSDYSKPTEDPDPGFMYMGILSLNPSSRDVGDLKLGETRTFEFVISNIGISDPYRNIRYLDIEWEIDIPDMFKDHITVSHSSGSLTPGVKDRRGVVTYDENNSCTVTVNLDTSGLSSGIYNCDIGIICDGGYGDSKVFNLDFSVGAVFLRYSPEMDVLSLGRPDIGEFSFDIWNGGYGTLNYDLSVSCYACGGKGDDAAFRTDWIELSKTSGDSTGKYDRDTVTVTVDTSSLAEWTVNNSKGGQGKFTPGLYNGEDGAGTEKGWGLYRCNINIDSNAAEDNGKGYVVLYVDVGPRIEFSFDSGSSSFSGGAVNIAEYLNQRIGNNDFTIDLGVIKRGEIKKTSFELWNRNPGELEWNIVIPELYENWVDVSPKSGVSMGPDDPCTVTVSIDTKKIFQDYVTDGINIRQFFPYTTVLDSDSRYHISRPYYACRPGIHDEFIVIESNDPTIYKMPKDGKSTDAWPHFNFDYYVSECEPDEDYDMLIISTPYLMGKGNSLPTDHTLEDLAKAHEELDGFNVSIKSTLDILWDYYPTMYKRADLSRDYRLSTLLTYPTDINYQGHKTSALPNALALREFIRDAYMHWGVEYVLLAGDDNWNMYEDFDPDKKCGLEYPCSVYYGNLASDWTKVGSLPPEVDGHLWNKGDVLPYINRHYNYGSEYYVSHGDREIQTFQVSIGKTSSLDNPVTAASDLPYSYLGRFNDGKTPTDGLNLGAEFGMSYNYVSGVSDSDPEVYVGRAPVNTVDELSNFVHKTVSYMKSTVTDEYLNSVVVGEFLGWTGQSSPSSDDYSYGENQSSYSGGNWDTFTIRDCGTAVAGKSYEVSIHTLYPYNEEDYPEYNNDLPSSKKTPRDLYIKSIVMMVTAIGNLSSGQAGGGTADFVDFGKEFSNTEGWTYVEEYNGYACGKINYKVNPKGGSVTLTIGSNMHMDFFETEGITSYISIYVNFYDHSKPDYDTFVVKVDGNEVGRYDDSEAKVASSSDCNSASCYGGAVFSWPLQKKLIDGADGLVGIPSAKFSINGLHDDVKDDDSSFFNDFEVRGWIGDDMINLINQGVGIISHMGRSEKQWPEYPSYNIMRMGEHDIRDLSNTVYPIVFSTADYAGQFDNNEGFSIYHARQMGELLLCDENGIVAGVFNSERMSGDESDAGKYQSMFWHKVFGENHTRIGDAFSLSKQSVRKGYNLYYGLNLFGDPALKIKGAEKIDPEPAVSPKSENIGLISYNETYSTSFDVYNVGDGNLVWDIEDNVEPIIFPFDHDTFVEIANEMLEDSNSSVSLSELKDRLKNFHSGMSSSQFECFDPESLNEGYVRYFYERFLRISPKSGNSMGPNDKTTVTVTLDIPSWEGFWNENWDTYDALDVNNIIPQIMVNVTLYILSSTFSYDINLVTNTGDSETFTLLINVDSPLVGSIPDQSIFVGDSFSDINLDSFVSDSDTPIEDISWSVSGNSNISVDISWDNVASIGYSSGWTGCKSFTFTATDDMGLSDSTEVVFEVSYDPDNNRAVISMPSPVNGSTGIPVDIGMLSVNIVDSEGDRFDWSITTVPDIGSSSGTAEYGGFKTCNIDGPLMYNTSYKWFVSAVDYGSGRESRSVFVFTTDFDPNADNGDSDEGGGSDSGDSSDDGSGEGDSGGEYLVDSNVPPVVDMLSPVNGSTGVSVELGFINVSIVDSEGDIFNWSISTVPDIGSCSQIDDLNGTKSCSVSDLDFNTTYTVFVNATDMGSGNTTSCVFGFTTETNGSDEDNESGDSEPVDVSVDIVSPVDGGFYLFNKLKGNFFNTIIVGDFDFVVNVSGNNISSVKNICFYLDGVLIDNVSFNESVSIYTCILDGFHVGFGDLIVKVFDTGCEVVAFDSLKDILMINFGIL